MVRLNSLLKNSVARRFAPSGAKASIETAALIAAVNRCATQTHDQNRVFQQTVKPASFQSVEELGLFCAATEAVPYPNPIYESSSTFS
ncbi:MAG: hypothetical protein WAL71_01070 [Terriglobales bacterium]